MSRTPREHDPQRAPDRAFELREVVDGEGITVELLVEGERLFSGRIREVDLAEMFRMLGLAREDVVAQLGRQLVARFEQERARVNLSPPVLASAAGGEGDGDRLVSRYVTDGGRRGRDCLVRHLVSFRRSGPSPGTRSEPNARRRTSQAHGDPAQHAPSPARCARRAVVVTRKVPRAHATPGFQSELPLRTDAEGRERIEL
jgi:hypothetical protein